MYIVLNVKNESIEKSDMRESLTLWHMAKEVGVPFLFSAWIQWRIIQNE